MNAHIAKIKPLLPEFEVLEFVGVVEGSVAVELRRDGVYLQQQTPTELIEADPAAAANFLRASFKAATRHICC